MARKSNLEQRAAMWLENEQLGRQVSELSTALVVAQADAQNLRRGLEEARKFMSDMLGPANSRSALCYGQGQWEKGMCAGILSCLDHLDRIVKPILDRQTSANIGAMEARVLREAAEKVLKHRSCTCAFALEEEANRRENGGKHDKP